MVDEDKFEYGKDVCGVLVQYPDTTGSINDYKVGTKDHLWVDLITVVHT